MVEKGLLDGGDLFAHPGPTLIRKARNWAITILRVRGFPDYMLSPALRQLFERVRTRLGLEVEIFDSGLVSLYPENSGDLGRMIQESKSVRAALHEAMAAGRPHEVERSGASYTLYPLRPSARGRQPAGLLAIRWGTSPADVRMPGDAEPWSDLARTVIEAELTAADSVQEERQRARRLVAALRFVRHLSQTTDEDELNRALVQAAAIWFDLDARVYRRDLAGDLVLHTWLPGAEVDDSSRRLNGLLLNSGARLTRLVSGSGLVDLGITGPEALLVPLASTEPAEWVLALVGQIPAEAEPIFDVVAGVAGAQFEALRAARSQEVHRRFETLVLQGNRAPELVALSVMRELAAETGASSATLTLQQGDRARRLVAIGTSPTPTTMPSGDSELFAVDQFVCCISIGPGIRALVELRPATDAEFTPDAALVTRACVSSLRMWLAGALSSLQEPPAHLIGEADAENFARRIQEEIERARRFDLRLSLVLVDIGAPGTAHDVVASVQAALRRELRGSDILGAVNRNQLAALLIQTDAQGLSHVVGRLRHRLVDAAGHLNVSRITLGQAAFSPECKTADALVMQAIRQAEPIVVH